ncbi:MAG: signal peptidase II [Clostridiales bacterium]|nr:signal peptidase II [Clostridiales bacterium]
MTKKTEKKKPISLKGSCLWGLLLFAVLVLIDLVTKVVADIYMDEGDKIPLISDWFGLYFIYNDGMAYGMGSNAPKWVKILVIVGTGVLMAAFAIVYFRLDKRRSFLRIAIVFVVAGGVGNLIDRIYYQVWNPTNFGVRDMVDLSAFGFATCNFADFFITGGAVALVLALLFFDKDAVFPVGKYKALAKEAEELKLAKKKEKTETKADEKNNG